MRKADNLPPYRAVVMKSVSLNFLEPSGPAQAGYGRALLLPFRKGIHFMIQNLLHFKTVGCHKYTQNIKFTV